MTGNDMYAGVRFSMAVEIKKNRRNLASIFADVLRPLGFAQKGRFFVREQEECFQIVDIQGSQYGSATYVNQTVWFKALGSYPGGEGAFHFSARMESQVESERAHWENVLRATEEKIDKNKWKDEIRSLLLSRLPLFELVISTSMAIESEKSGLLAGCWLGAHLFDEES